MENASSSSTVQWKYDVFISFRGEDTRNNFTDYLYNALIGKGINTFRDDEKLERGKPISPELLKAIEESRVTVVILSKDYASSPWCLDELAKIIACKENMGMIVLPVFHYVEPSDVRRQMGTFAQAFVKHEEKEEKTKVDKWRDALRQVGNLAGWHLKNTRPEFQVIQEIVGWISLNLKYKYDAFAYITKDLVGMHSRLVELESYLALDSKDVLFIGIWGMGGMGKTTLARVVYHMVSKEFEARGFIEDVRKNFENYGCVPLQQKIIDDILKDKDLKIEEEYDGVCKIRSRLSRKKILLVLDDVDKPKQLEMLSGEHDWFGPGSRIIITARDKNVLEAHGVNEIYEVKGLIDENALQLFCSKAFRKKHVLDDYIELSNHFLKYASGLPLALEVLGSFLFGKNTVEWKTALERLQKFPYNAILQVLVISFNGLEEPQKEIFLHIACFFNNQKKDDVLEILDILGLYPKIGLKELTDKSLLKIMDNDVVWMHDLLEKMGRNIVCQECLDDPGKRSRLWDYEDINKVLKKNKGTKALKAIDIASTCNEQQDGSWNPKAFLKMDNLKFLRIYGTLYVPTHLPNDLRILDWISYPSKSLPSSFQLDELVQLRLQQSQIIRLWTGIKNFDKLKFIDLTDSLDLFITPDFTGVPNLEKLVLVRCTNLRRFHPSIGILKELKYLNLEDCERLIRLPSKFEMESLETLEISNCPKGKRIPKFVINPKFLQELSLDRTPIVDLIKNLPENLGIIKGLEILYLSKADIEELPSSIGRLIGLTSLTLRYCENLVSLPNTICNLELLKSLDLFGCLKFHKLPKNIGNVKGLELLNLCWTAIRDVPPSIALLKNLKHLYICRWKSSDFYSLPTSLERLGSVITSLISASHVNPIISGCQMSLEHGSRQPLQLLLPSLSGLQSLTDLHLSDCSLLSIPNDIGCLSSLECLNLSGNDFVSLPKSMSQLSYLRRLHLEGCNMLWSLENVPSTIDSVIANNCTSLMRLPELQFYSFRSDHSHLNFQFVNCFNLARYIGSRGSMLQGQSGKLPDIFDIIIPKVCFPKRLEHESVSHELKVQVPYGCDELMGIELCVCFSVAEDSKDFLLTCWIKVNGFESTSPIRSSFRENYGRVSSCHLWRLYLSPRYFESQWGENFRQIDGNGSNKIEIRISTSNNLEVEKVGIHYDIINDSASKGTQNKQSRDEDDGVGPFGEGYSIDEPPLKIRKFLTSLPEEITRRRRDKLSRELSLDRTTIVDLIKNLPENLWIIKGLEILDLSKVDIEELPSSIEGLIGLTSLTLRYCENLVSLPNTICNLELLKSLDLFGCLKFRNLPKNIGNVKGLELLNLCWTVIRDVPPSIALLKNLKYLYICRWKSSDFYSLPTSLERLGSVITSLNHVNPIISGCQMSLEHGSRQPLKLLLPSLSGLQSLTNLHLSDCSLLSIPNDIGCLSSLECLNLSGNDFVSLPESMSQLSYLRRLHLEGCKMLRSLENVPSTIDSVIANNCTSLMRLPDLQFYSFRSDHSHLNFQFVNCFSLARYIGSRGSMLEGQSGKLPDTFDIIVPRCFILGHFAEVPFSKRFEHESLSREWKGQVSYGCDELMGIELCVCFSVVEASEDFQLKCWIKVNGFESSSPICSSIRANYGRVSLRHLWRLYLSPYYFDSQFGENFCQIDGNGSNKIEIRISTSNKLEVEEVEIHYDIINDSASKGTQNKRSHDEDDGARPFGEGYSIDEPPPKIRKILTEKFEEIICRRGDKLISREKRLVRTQIGAAPDRDAEWSAI